MFQAICKYQTFKKSDPLLEIGIGTGIGTVPFAERGNPITAVEPGKNLISIAKKRLRKYTNITYVIKSLENAELPDNYFALAYAAQAFHWVDPKIGLDKVYTVLRPGGMIAFFWNTHDPRKPGIARDTRRLYVKYKMKPKKRFTAQGVIQQVKKSPHFSQCRSYDIPWVKYYSKQSRLKLLLTYSAVIALSPQQKRKFIQDTKFTLQKYSSPLKVPMITKLVLARKIT